MADEQAALSEVMNLLEADPESSPPSQLPITLPVNDTPAQREKLAVLVSTGKCKEAIGVQLTHDQVKRFTEKDVEKYYKQYEAYAGSKTSESLMQSFSMLFSKGISMVVEIDDVEALREDLYQDYIINSELSSLAGKLALRCGRLLAVANAALITTKHICTPKKVEPKKESGEEPGEEPVKNLNKNFVKI